MIFLQDFSPLSVGCFFCLGKKILFGWEKNLFGYSGILVIQKLFP